MAMDARITKTVGSSASAGKIDDPAPRRRLIAGDASPVAELPFGAITE